jgi:superfamily II DNA helicase RecQ
VPAYVVFSNKTLEALARARPASRDELLAVSGIGPSRAEAYGDAILEALQAE